MNVALDTKIESLVAAARTVAAANVALRAELADARERLADALDDMHELRNQITTRDNIIAELQELRAKEGPR